MNATNSRLARIAGLLVFTSVVLFGCGAAPAAETATTEAPTQTDGASVAEATATPETLAGTVINGLPTKPVLANDGKGVYIQTTISPDDPALKYNPAVVNPSATDRFSEAEIADAHKMIVTFIAEEVYDSTLNGNHGDHANVDLWFAQHKDILDSEQTEGFVNATKNDISMHLVMRGNHRDGKYELDYGPNAVHVAEREITIDDIRGGPINGKEYLGVHATGSVTHVVRSKGNKVWENTIPDLNFTLGRVDGRWVIVGFQNTFSISPAE